MDCKTKMRAHCRRLTHPWRPTKQHGSSLLLMQRLLSSSKNKGPSVASSGLDDAPSTAGLREKLLKAPFQRVEKANRPPLFPWRHSGEPLPRLDPTSPEFHEKGQLLGGNIYTSHPLIDEIATAWMFMNVPLHKLVFFRDWQDDLAEKMSWAFVQGVAGILSNVYRVPMDQLSNGEGNLRFDHGTDKENEGESSETEDGDSSNILDETDFMVEENLRKLYQSAHEFGKHQLQIRLECRPTMARIENLFVFPFLSRKALKRTPALKAQYQQLLEVIAVAPREAIPIYQDLVMEMTQRGNAESTIIVRY